MIGVVVMLFLSSQQKKELTKPYGNTVKPGTMTENGIKKFEVGKRYGMNSACDQKCWWYYTVIGRTKSTVTLKDESGKIKTCRINKRDTEYFKAESCNPLGTYSMHPFLTAEKEFPQQAELKAEESRAKIIRLSDHGTLIIAGLK